MDTDYEGELWIDSELMRLKQEHELARIRNEKLLRFPVPLPAQ
jgi:hypothetical protein